MADPSDQRGFKGFLPIMGLCLACFSIGLAISWYLMNSHYLRVKLDCEKAEISLNELSKDLGRVKTENDGLRKLVREKDDIINEIKNKEPENAGKLQNLIEQLKSDNINLSDKLKQKELELDNCNSGLRKIQEESKQLQQSKDLKGADGGIVANYEYKMKELSVPLHQTRGFPIQYNFHISIAVKNIKNDKVDAIVGGSGYPNLLINEGKVNQKYSYKSDCIYEIIILGINRNSVRFLITQKKEVNQ